MYNKWKLKLRLLSSHLQMDHIPPAITSLQNLLFIHLQRKSIDLGSIETWT